MTNAVLHLLAFAFLSSATPAGAAHLLLDLDKGPVVEAEINGIPLRLKVELDHNEGVSLNPSSAARAGLGSGHGDWTEVIGPVKLLGRFARAAIGVAGRTVKASVQWHNRMVVADADGTIAVHLLPFESVTMRRREAAGPERDRTVAPAAAASVIAAHQGGVLEEAQSSEEIGSGVRRPVRRLLLERPLAIGELLIPALMARTSDWRGDHLLPATSAASEAEIIVTGAPLSQSALYRITIGLDVLQRCSSATYVRETNRLSFRCALD